MSELATVLVIVSAFTILMVIFDHIGRVSREWRESWPPLLALVAAANLILWMLLHIDGGGW